MNLSAPFSIKRGNILIGSFVSGGGSYQHSPPNTLKFCMNFLSSKTISFEKICCWSVHKD